MLQDWDETDSFCTVLTHSGASTNQTRTGLSQVHSGRIGFKFQFDSKTVSFTYVISPHQLEGIGWRGGSWAESLKVWAATTVFLLTTISTLLPPFRPRSVSCPPSLPLWSCRPLRCFEGFDSCIYFFLLWCLMMWSNEAMVHLSRTFHIPHGMTAIQLWPVRVTTPSLTAPRLTAIHSFITHQCRAFTLSVNTLWMPYIFSDWYQH